MCAKKNIYGVSINIQTFGVKYNSCVVTDKNFMKINLRHPVINTLTRPSFLSPAVFLGIGAAKTVSDYRKAPNDEKAQTLLRDVSILAGSVSAFALISPVTNAFCNTKFFNLFLDGTKLLLSKVFKKSIKPNKVMEHTKSFVDYTEYVVKQAIAGTLNTLAGIAGAVGADFAMEKYVLSKPPFLKTSEKLQDDKKTLVEDGVVDESPVVQSEESSAVLNDVPLVDGGEIVDVESSNLKNVKEKGYFSSSNVFNKFDYSGKDVAKKAANRVVSTVSDIPEMKMLSSPMIALTGFSVANTDGYNNKIKKTSYELLANTMIPTLFVTAVSVIVENKRALIKYPSLLTSLLVGAFCGKKVADNLQESMNKKIDYLCMK